MSYVLDLLEDIQVPKPYVLTSKFYVRKSRNMWKVLNAHGEQYSIHTNRAQAEAEKARLEAQYAKEYAKAAK